MNCQKKAIQAGLDTGSNAIKELKGFISSFIIKYVPKKKVKKKKKQDNNEKDITSNYNSSDEDFILIEILIVYSKK
ncbi:23600_t:CDS:1, partial [Cetraspora pellucida]